MTAVIIAAASIYVGKAAAIFFLVKHAIAQGEIEADVSNFMLMAVSFGAVPGDLGPFDLLFFGLAGFTAFKVGSGLSSND